MSYRRQRSIPLGGRYRQVSLYIFCFISHNSACSVVTKIFWADVHTYVDKPLLRWCPVTYNVLIWTTEHNSLELLTILLCPYLKMFLDLRSTIPPQSWSCQGNALLCQCSFVPQLSIFSSVPITLGSTESVFYVQIAGVAGLHSRRRFRHGTVKNHSAVILINGKTIERWFINYISNSHKQQLNNAL